MNPGNFPLIIRQYNQTLTYDPGGPIFCYYVIIYSYNQIGGEDKLAWVGVTSFKGGEKTRGRISPIVGARGVNEEKGILSPPPSLQGKTEMPYSREDGGGANER